MTANYEMSTKMDGRHVKEHSEERSKYIGLKYIGLKFSRQEAMIKIDDNTEHDRWREIKSNQDDMKRCRDSN